MAGKTKPATKRAPPRKQSKASLALDGEAVADVLVARGRLRRAAARWQAQYDGLVKGAR